MKETVYYILSMCQICGAYVKYFVVKEYRHEYLAHILKRIDVIHNVPSSLSHMYATVTGIISRNGLTLGLGGEVSFCPHPYVFTFHIFHCTDHRKIFYSCSPIQDHPIQTIYFRKPTPSLHEG